ncbi:MAG TPA: tetratricopeptide repeat protein, partial [Myxococcota bacterium]|nr:tetratricopeptide repeat protein [Myxococcota bacterium]
PPSSLGAWELVQRATRSSFHETPSLQRSREVLDLLERAVELDSGYAYARAAYSWMLFSAAINGWAEDPAATLRAGEAQLSAALDLDTSDPLTQYYVGAAYLYTARNEKAVRFLDQSLASNPHQPDALAHLGLAWGYLARFERAHACFDQADRMASLRETTGIYGWYRGIVLGLEGRYDEVVPIVRRFLEHYPRYATARCTLGIAYEMTGEPERARTAIERASELDPGLNVDGIALNLSTHPDPEKGREREAILRRYWPGDRSGAVADRADGGPVC